MRSWVLPDAYLGSSSLYSSRLAPASSLALALLYKSQATTIAGCIFHRVLLNHSVACYSLALLASFSLRVSSPIWVSSAPDLAYRSSYAVDSSPSPFLLVSFPVLLFHLAPTSTPLVVAPLPQPLRSLLYLLHSLRDYLCPCPAASSSLSEHSCTLKPKKSNATLPTTHSSKEAECAT